jgi:outer membrane protein assembly factor BamB
MQDLASSFAGYRLHNPVGKDAVSTTYRAAEEGRNGAGRTVTLQVSAPLSTGINRRRATLFQRKATAAMDIDHPGIAQVLDVGITDDRVYAVTAWRPSLTLDQVIGRHWRLDVDEAVAMLRPLAEGLDAAHAAGVVHAALGTRSIRVATGTDDEPPVAFATGFGCDALLALRLSSKRERDTGMVPDDLLYVAPEQLRDGRIEPATDQYAVACALYHCLTGEPPFVRETVSALFGAHLFARPPVTDALAGAGVSSARSAIATGLAKDPDERHPSCATLIRVAGTHLNGDRATTVAFDPVAAATAGAAAPSTPPPAPVDEPARARRPSWLRRVPMAAFVAVAAVAGLIAASVLVNTMRGAGTVGEPDRQPAQDQDAAGEAPADDEGTGRSGADADADGDAPPTIATAWQRPAVDGRVGSLTVTNDAVVVTSDSDVAVLDPASGERDWRETVDGGSITSTEVTDAAVVYRSRSGLRALALADGTQLWVHNHTFTPTGSLSAVPSGPLYGMGPGVTIPELIALDAATGEEEWYFDGDLVTTRQNAAVAADDQLAAILQNGALFGVDPAAEQSPSGVDRSRIKDEVFRVTVGRPWRSSLTLDDEAVLLARRNGAVCSYDRLDGARRWCTPLEDVRDARPHLIVSGGTVVVVTPSTVTALDGTSGGLLWTTRSDTRITAATGGAREIVIAERPDQVRALDPVSGEARGFATAKPRITALAAGTDVVYAGTRDGDLLRLEHSDGAP